MHNVLSCTVAIQYLCHFLPLFHLISLASSPICRPALHSGGTGDVPPLLCSLPCPLVPLDPHWECQRKLLLCHDTNLCPCSGTASGATFFLLPPSSNLCGIGSQAIILLLPLRNVTFCGCSIVAIRMFGTVHEGIPN